ncbi:MAG: MFS transporter [Caldilineaceae bacterium]
MALAHQLSPAAAQRMLYSLMFPSMLMPLISSMTRVALPMIRDAFAISADMTAWVATAFTLPFMMLMPIIGRLSDSVGKRRLLLAGIAVFWLGSIITVVATGLTWIMIGRVIQGMGVSGMMPLGMAFISTIFRKEERGRALGTWSSVGPVVGFVSPLFAGFLVDMWDWRAAFVPAVLVGIVAFAVVYKSIPSGLSTIRPNFLRTFDWIGALLLSLSTSLLLFYLSSRPITGVAPLRDWRLGSATLIALVAFLLWEQRHVDPFIRLSVFQNGIFSLSSFCGAMRMFTMAGAGFLLPLYLVDIHGIPATALGLMLMLNPGAMALMVRIGGWAADRWGSRWPVIAGFAAQAGVMFGYWLLPANASLWTIGALQVTYGLGVGLMLAALHRSAMGTIADEQMGAAAGLYSMIRFLGMAIGTALAGVLLQNYLDTSIAPIAAYQWVYFYFGVGSSLGILFTFFLQEPQKN